MNPKVDTYISELQQWKEETALLRAIAMECNLYEELKWGKPCYSFNQSNVVIIQGFKKYCALLFFKGVLLQDSDKLLVKTGENTRVGRQLRFTGTDEIEAIKKSIKAYIFEAIEVEKSGAKPDKKDNEISDFPEELLQKFKELPALKLAFEALTPGRQRAYVFHFKQAKQASTRVGRIEKFVPKILEGKGMMD